MAHRCRWYTPRCGDDELRRLWTFVLVATALFGRLSDGEQAGRLALFSRSSWQRFDDYVKFVKSCYSDAAALSQTDESNSTTSNSSSDLVRRADDSAVSPLDDSDCESTDNPDVCLYWKWERTAFKDALIKELFPNKRSLLDYYSSTPNQLLSSLWVSDPSKCPPTAASQRPQLPPHKQSEIDATERQNFEDAIINLMFANDFRVFEGDK